MSGLKVLLRSGTSRWRVRWMCLEENRFFLLKNLRLDRNRRLETAESEARAFLFSFFGLCGNRSGFQARAASAGEFQIRKLAHELLCVAQRDRRLFSGLCWSGWQTILIMRFLNPQHNLVNRFRWFRRTWTRTFLHFLHVQILIFLVLLQRALILLRKMISEGFCVLFYFLTLFVQWRHRWRRWGRARWQWRSDVVLWRRWQIHHQVRLKSISSQDRWLRLIRFKFDASYARSLLPFLPILLENGQRLIFVRLSLTFCWRFRSFRGLSVDWFGFLSLISRRFRLKKKTNVKIHLKC